MEIGSANDPGTSLVESWPEDARLSDNVCHGMSNVL
jgi:hypothetical protein